MNKYPNIVIALAMLEIASEERNQDHAQWLELIYFRDHSFPDPKTKPVYKFGSGKFIKHTSPFIYLNLN